jgi:alkanesulfonate monooxygenase SsuD/methylene tetrahydromethanopterin reductase-like flavin-dependent oxidoreductase (luciferase family)
MKKERVFVSKIKYGVYSALDPEDINQGKDHIKNVRKYLDSLANAYESVWIPDHLIPEMKPYHREYLECLTTTSYLLPQYPNLKFGQLVLGNNYRNPALLAKMSSTLQVLSGGRFILGIGAGWYQEEYKQYGYEFPSPRTRIKQLEEAVQIIKMMWQDDEVTFHGEHYRIENACCNPKPDPAPPIVIGGGGEKYTLNVVAKYADWWNGFCFDVETWTHKLNVLSNHCDDVGRDFKDILKSDAWGVAIADSEEEADKIAKHSQYYYQGVFLIGTPESIILQMGELVDAGVEYFQLYFPQYRNIETTQLFADEVIPELKT